MNKEYFYLFTDVLIKETGLYASDISKGIRELIEQDWIQKSNEKSKYWLNICLVCKGMREEIYREFTRTKVR